jgi:hypothetical protein
VYVQLEATPWVWRVQWPDDPAARPPSVTSHTGLPAQVRSCWVDAEGRLYLGTDLGLGIVHSQDMLDASRAIEQGLWDPQDAGRTRRAAAVRLRARAGALRRRG